MNGPMRQWKLLTEKGPAVCMMQTAGPFCRMGHHQSLFTFFILDGCDTCDALKGFGEILRLTESHLDRHIVDRIVSLLEEFLCPVNPIIDDKFNWADAQLLFKELAQIDAADV